MSDGVDRAAPRTRYRLRLLDILLSLFVVFCVTLTVSVLSMSLARPYVSQDESLVLGAMLVLFTTGSLSLLLAGAGWARHLNLPGLIAVSFAGWLFLGAGLYEFFGMHPWVTFPVSLLLLYLGSHYANHRWVERAVIIKISPRYEELPVSSPDEYETSTYSEIND